MAINFPTNPVNGQTFLALGRGWQYNSTSGSWEALIRVNTAFDSDDITEGTTNKYLNNENIDDRVAGLKQLTMMMLMMHLQLTQLLDHLLLMIFYLM
jgi:hypothetical protein